MSTVLPIPGHFIVPDCFCPGRGTHTRDSGTVPGIPGQLVTLRLSAEMAGKNSSEDEFETLHYLCNIFVRKSSR